MKHLSIFFALITITLCSMAQQLTNNSLTRANALKYNIAINNTVHIISPEAIIYVDISDPKVDGQISEKKLCRIKASKLKEGDQFSVTVVTNTFLAVYEMTCTSGNPGTETLVINLLPTESIPVNQPGYLKESDFRRLSREIISKNSSTTLKQKKAYDLKLSLNNIFIEQDYFLLDIGIKNKSKLPLDIDQLKFTIKDRKVLKATVSQDLQLEPVYRLCSDEDRQIKKSYRNFYCFKKFTFPSDKILEVELKEKQISGRKISLNIDYKLALNASTP